MGQPRTPARESQGQRELEVLALISRGSTKRVVTLRGRGRAGRAREAGHRAGRQDNIASMSDEQTALLRVSRLVATAAAPQVVLDTVTAEASACWTAGP